MSKLIIVESPTKAKTLGRFLGKDYEVIASMGHIRDIPSNKMNIDLEKNFEPVYEISKDKQKTVRQIQQLAKKADEILIATDPDREGEAIAYHIQYLLHSALKQKKDYKRITFHQITKSAVEEAINHAGVVDTKLFEAQQARRVLDRLVGYSLSPVLWRKVRRGLSAGRVQSVSLRLVVEREREIEAFKPQEYWEIKVKVSKDQKDNNAFWVELTHIDGKQIVTGKGDDRKFSVNDKDKASDVVSLLKLAEYVVKEVVRKETKRKPKPPFTTSLLQQAASNSLGFTSKRTMSVAQQLYEKGLITYHRTDSFHLAKEAIDMARDHILNTYGKEYLPDSPKSYLTKSKSAQEAHEAIRPTEVSKLPHLLLDGVDASGKKLYGLIWKRFVACQMTDAIFDATVVKVGAKKDNREFELKANGSIMKFDGFLKVYRQKSEEGDVQLPEIQKDETLEFKDLTNDQKFTQPPPRYNDASLVKALEQLGIGRPSTYAPTISTLLARGYMERTDRRFFPTAVGLTVTDFLVENFGEVMDYAFTAQMEDDLDKIAEGKIAWVPMMKEFWDPFDKKVDKVIDKADRVKVPVEKTGKLCPTCGATEKGEVIIRTGKFGKFLSCSRFPDCKYTAQFHETLPDIVCEKCGKGEVVVKRTRKGRVFYGCTRYPDCDWASWNDPRKSEEEKSQVTSDN